jgi:alpha-beta hydrolase superfamily lysophospholipase
VTEVLQRLERVRQQRIARNPRTRSRLVVVGHSFGGAVVFSALEQILESRFVLTAGTPEQPAGPVQGFGDLVVLINPAFEAQLFQPLNDLSTQQPTYEPSQLPVLAILTSEADLATKVAFPLGRWFSTRFDPYRTHTLNAVQRRAAPAPTDVARTAEQNADASATASQGWQDDEPGGRIYATSSPT